jgi:aryl-alcohol dehydrogenase (NADP+)
MQYPRLGKSGLKVSRLCLGCMSYGQAEGRHAEWTLDEAASRSFIKTALEQGLNFFDTANGYAAGQSEEILGRALKDFATRDEVVIATKIFSPMGKGANASGLSRKSIITETDACLRRLGTDYIDLLQIHRWDNHTPIEETMEALHDVVKAGKVSYIGASSMYAWQFAKAQHTADLHGWTRFISMQPQLNLLYREEEREMLPLCNDQSVGVIPWSPLARGFLAGNRFRDGGGETARAKSDPWGPSLFYRPVDFSIADRLAEVAKARGDAPMRVALAWVLTRLGVTAPIIGATKPHHLTDAIAALDIKLSSEECSLLEELYQPRTPFSLS